MNIFFSYAAIFDLELTHENVWNLTQIRMQFHYLKTMS